MEGTYAQAGGAAPRQLARLGAAAAAGAGASSAKPPDEVDRLKTIAVGQSAPCPALAVCARAGGCACVRA